MLSSGGPASFAEHQIHAETDVERQTARGTQTTALLHRALQGHSQCWTSGLPPGSKGLRAHPVFHVSLLKRYKPDNTYQPPMPYELEGDLVYDVERIINHRYVKRSRGPHKLQYLVKWEGYGPEHDSWEPEVNLRDAPEPLSKYLLQTGQELKPPTVAQQRLRPAPAKKRKRGGRGPPPYL